VGREIAAAVNGGTNHLVPEERGMECVRIGGNACTHSYLLGNVPYVRSLVISKARIANSKIPTHPGPRPVAEPPPDRASGVNMEVHGPTVASMHAMPANVACPAPLAIISRGSSCFTTTGRPSSTTLIVCSVTQFYRVGWARREPETDSRIHKRFTAKFDLVRTHRIFGRCPAVSTPPVSTAAPD
jgi:hypothetical protein